MTVEVDGHHYHLLSSFWHHSSFTTAILFRPAGSKFAQSIGGSVTHRYFLVTLSFLSALHVSASPRTPPPEGMCFIITWHTISHHLTTRRSNLFSQHIFPNKLFLRQASSRPLDIWNPVPPASREAQAGRMFVALFFALYARFWLLLLLLQCWLHCGFLEQHLRLRYSWSIYCYYYYWHRFANFSVSVMVVLVWQYWLYYFLVTVAGFLLRYSQPLSSNKQQAAAAAADTLTHRRGQTNTAAPPPPASHTVTRERNLLWQRASTDCLSVCQSFFARVIDGARFVAVFKF